MEQYVKKYFWILIPLVVVVCAYLSAKAVNHVIAGKYLIGDAEAQRPPPVVPRAKPAATRSKVGEPIAQRNIFCSDCVIEEPSDEVDDGPSDGSIQNTSLPIYLVATNLSRREGRSFATIRNTDTEQQGAYWVGQMIPDAGKVEIIAGKYVDFRRDNGRLERIPLLGAAPAPSRRPTPTPRVSTAPSTNRDELSAELDEGINKVSEDKYQIDRNLVDKMLANPMSVARGARIVPSVKNGKPNGFKLYAIRPSSVYAKIGLMNGDTIHAINGFELTTPDKALEVYTKVKEASSLSVNITRRGKPVTIDYSIR